MRDLGLGDVEVVAFAGDWHGNLHWAKRALEYAKKTHSQTKVVLQVGDFGFYRKIELDVLNEKARMLDLILAFVDGNHEDFGRLYANPPDADGVRRLRERVWHLPRGLRWQWAGQRFLALGGAVSVDKYSRTAGYDWWPEEELTETQVFSAIEGGTADIMLCHDTPTGYVIPGLMPPGFWPADRITASEQHRKLLGLAVAEVNPYLLVHGHYHVRYSQFLPGSERPVFILGLDRDGDRMENNVELAHLPSLADVRAAG
jgi:hypothetical protein